MTKVSEELFCRFIDGETTPEETMTVIEEMKNNKELMDKYISIRRFDAMMAEEEDPALPMDKTAAKAEDNLCDIMCERYIMRTKFPMCGNQSLLGEAKDEQRFLKEARGFDEEAWINKNNEFFSTDIEKLWLTSKGVALYNVGRIMEGHGLAVTRHFYSNLDFAANCLSLGEGVIAIVNEELLEGVEPESMNPNHAVCVNSISEDTVTLYNPSTGNLSDDYPLDRFLEAWSTSKNYLVAAGLAKKKSYVPTPLNLENVELDDNLQDLLEAIAENAHDVWALDRQKEGYVYGEVRDDVKKTHPDMRPYSELPETEKDYDRKMAISTLKLAQRLGFKIIRPDSENDYHCPVCGKRISLEMVFCPHCGRELQLGDFSG